MNLDLSDEATEYGRLALRALEAAGGDRLVQEAEAEPGRRAAAVVGALAELGAWDLDPRAGPDELEAAAALCRSAGYWSAPYPVAERLCRPPGLDVVGLVVVAEVGPAAPLAGLEGEGRWAAVTPGGHRSLAIPRRPTSPPRTTAFVTGLDLHPVDGPAVDRGGPVAGGGPGGGGSRPGDRTLDVALGLVLPCWGLLGMLDRALELTLAYILDRRQFGQALSSFQGVQFQLTDAEVERAGLDELARYALWSIGARRPDAVADALALRMAALEAAEVVFRVAHQLHGAIGFCDETALSWLSRHSQPVRRLPLGLSATRDRFTTEIGRHGLSGLFDALAPAAPGPGDRRAAGVVAAERGAPGGGA